MPIIGSADFSMTWEKFRIFILYSWPESWINVRNVWQCEWIIMNSVPYNFPILDAEGPFDRGSFAVHRKL